MSTPSPRVLDLLLALRELRPEQARTLLQEAMAVLDEAELAALRRQLPSTELPMLEAGESVALARSPGPGQQLARQPNGGQTQAAVTVMNRMPMPWEITDASFEAASAPSPAPAPNNPKWLVPAAAGASALIALAVFGWVHWPTPGHAEETPPKVSEPAPRPVQPPTPALGALEPVVKPKPAAAAPAKSAKPKEDPFARRR
jgi:hypothetical protein